MKNNFYYSILALLLAGFMIQGFQCGSPDFTGAKVQVIAVCQHDLGTEPVVVGGAQVFDRATGAHRHEARRAVRAA